MDALIKICEDELRRRQRQNSRLKGFVLIPIRKVDFIQIGSGAFVDRHWRFLKTREVDFVIARKFSVVFRSTNQFAQNCAYLAPPQNPATLGYIENHYQCVSRFQFQSELICIDESGFDVIVDQVPTLGIQEYDFNVEAYKVIFYA